MLSEGNAEKREEWIEEDSFVALRAPKSSAEQEIYVVIR